MSYFVRFDPNSGINDLLKIFPNLDPLTKMASEEIDPRPHKY